MKKTAPVTATERSRNEHGTNTERTKRGTVLIKIGGELLETPENVARIAREIVRASETSPVVVVHGGGRTIDAELALRGVARRAVDGLRVGGAVLVPAGVQVVQSDQEQDRPDESHDAAHAREPDHRGEEGEERRVERRRDGRA